jgi:hypothetical protein
MDPFIGPETAKAFGAIESIMSGDWDRYLIRIDTALRERMRTTAWTQHVVHTHGHPEGAA